MSPSQSKLTEFCIPEVKTKQRTLISNQQRWTYNQSSLNHLQLSTIKILREHMHISSEQVAMMELQHGTYFLII